MAPFLYANTVLFYFQHCLRPTRSVVIVLLPGSVECFTIVTAVLGYHKTEKTANAAIFITSVLTFFAVLYLTKRVTSLFHLDTRLAFGVGDIEGMAKSMDGANDAMNVYDLRKRSTAHSDSDWFTEDEAAGGAVGPSPEQIQRWAAEAAAEAGVDLADVRRSLGMAVGANRRRQSSAGGLEGLTRALDGRNRSPTVAEFEFIYGESGAPYGSRNPMANLEVEWPDPPPKEQPKLLGRLFRRKMN